MRSSIHAALILAGAACALPAIAQLTPQVGPISRTPIAIATPRTTPTLTPTKRLTISYRSSKWAVVRVGTADARLSCSTIPVPERGAVTNTCTADVAQGTVVTINGSTATLTGTGSPPYIGKLWGGDCAASTGTTCRLTLSGDRAVTIAF